MHEQAGGVRAQRSRLIDEWYPRAVAGHGHKNYLRPRQQARARGTARRHGWGAHGRAAASCIQVNTCRARSGSSPTPTVCRVAAAPGLRLLALAACLVLRPRVCVSVYNTPVLIY